MELAYSQPDGFAAWPVTPDAASFDEVLGESILPYAAVRTAPDPDALPLELLQSTDEAAATLGGWDRMALEVRPSWAGTPSRGLGFRSIRMGGQPSPVDVWSPHEP